MVKFSHISKVETRPESNICQTTPNSHRLALCGCKKSMFTDCKYLYPSYFFIENLKFIDQYYNINTKTKQNAIFMKEIMHYPLGTTCIQMHKAPAGTRYIKYIQAPDT